MCLYILYRDVKFLKTSLALIAGSFHLDTKIEEILHRKSWKSYSSCLKVQAGKWNFTPLL